MSHPSPPNTAWSPLLTRPSWPGGVDSPIATDARSLGLQLRGAMGESTTVGRLLDVIDAFQCDPALAGLYNDTALARLTVEDLLDVDEAEGSRALELGELIAAWMHPPTGNRPRNRNESLAAYLRAGIDYALAIEEMQASLTPDDGLWICRVGHLAERHANVATAVRACYVRWVTPIRERVERFDHQLETGQGNPDRIEALRAEITERAHAWRLTRYLL